MSQLSLIQIDDFAPDWFEVRNKVLAQGFNTEHYDKDGTDYKGICKSSAGDHFPSLIEQKLGKKIDVKLSCFRRNMSGEMPNSWVHSDEISANYGVVLYLNLPQQCQGGTAFWTHKDWGISFTPTKEDLDKQGVKSEDFWPAYKKQWLKKEAWQMTDLCTMKSNRLIIYPTSRIHSRWPWEGWGLSDADSRLVWVCFFDFKHDNIDES